MARRAVILMLMAFVAASALTSAWAEEGQAAAEPANQADPQVEIDRLNGWKVYLEKEVETAKAALEAEKARAEGLIKELEDAKASAGSAAATATAAADQKAAAAESRAAAAEAKLVEAETRAAAAEKKLADAEARASAAEKKLSTQIAATDAANGEAALLRRQLAEAVAERSSLEARVAELAAATQQAGGLKGHALGIYAILQAEAGKHRDTALAYANEKLPGLHAKVAEMHAKMPNVSHHVTDFVAKVDAELRPWTARALAQVPPLKQYAEDPVVLQAIVAVMLGSPVLLLLTLLMTCCCRSGGRRAETGRTGPGGRRPKGRKAKQG
ncbi:hypothetical protein HYH03_010336 [Edaphochlamys debaryana]|uniref:Uncharacterized protein n=1 Tax=Edaphochlamys debaryana TaxID=47281 RepID=A0A835XZK8_9CHLO|nr:hypothetical protein HYH03_010336 [Edaphochlamys debaryana]|eukprot:KAG2491331.1 hypothetical protein HYH03_010336 [Edaphochlamys debaryana]